MSKERMASYNEHFPIRVLVQQNGRHVRRVLIDVTDIYVGLKEEEQLQRRCTTRPIRGRSERILCYFVRIKE